MIELPDTPVPNAGPGPDPFRLTEIETPFLVIFFQRDYFCTNCRNQVQTIAERYNEFEGQDTTVVSILPESKDRARDWVEKYDLPFPLLADPDAELSDDFGQPVRFGLLGKFSDFLGRMPQILVIDCREEPEIIYKHQGSSTFDRPDLDEVLDAIDIATSS